MTQPVEFPPKKMPRQSRSQMTFDAIVEAAARVLVERGYSGMTTNHVADAAGVAIASLYEYFPHKDALVAQVAEKLRDRVVARLSALIPAVYAAQPAAGVEIWVQGIYRTLLEEKDIVAVLYYQVPFTNQLKQVREILPVLLNFSDRLHQGTRVQLQNPAADIFLMVNLVSSTILQLVLEPPDQPTVEDVLQALTLRLQQWLNVSALPLR